MTRLIQPLGSNCKKLLFLAIDDKIIFIMVIKCVKRMFFQEYED